MAIFAQGPIGLCATAGARLSGAGLIISVDSIEDRLKMARQVGADVTINFKEKDLVQAIMEVTKGRGVDVAIEALGTEATFQSCLRVLKLGGTLSSLGVYANDIHIPVSAFYAGLGDNSSRPYALAARNGCEDSWA